MGREAHLRVIQVANPAVSALPKAPDAKSSTCSTGPQGGGQINTADIERLNATFRARLRGLVRRGRSLTRQVSNVHAGMDLVGTVYNFCTYHRNLPLRRCGRPDHAGHRWLLRTPAMAAQITDHRWTVLELLAYQRPLRAGSRSSLTADRPTHFALLLSVGGLPTVR